MLSKEVRNDSYALVRTRGVGMTTALNAIKADHEAAVRGLRKLAIEKWQALGGTHGFSSPDEKWIQNTIEAATRESDALDRLQLAEGDAFDPERVRVDEERFAHDQGFGPDYAVEVANAIRLVTHGDGNWPRYFAEVPGYAPLIMTYDLATLISVVVEDHGASLKAKYLVQDGPEAPRRVIGNY